MANVSKWTDAMIARTAELWLSGKSAAETAAMIRAEFGVVFSRNAIVGKIHRMGHHRATEAPRRAVKRTKTATVIERPKTKPLPAPKATTAAPSLRVPVTELRSGQCRFGTHETPDGDHLFCGHPVKAGRSYCEAHWSVTVDHGAIARAKKKKGRSHEDIKALRVAQRESGLTRVFG